MKRLIFIAMSAAAIAAAQVAPPARCASPLGEWVGNTAVVGSTGMRGMRGVKVTPLLRDTAFTDFYFASPQSVTSFQTDGRGKLSYAGGAMVYSYRRPGAIFVTSLSVSSRGRNAVGIVLDNRSAADSLRLSVAAAGGALWENEKTFAISTEPGMRSYTFDISDLLIPEFGFTGVQPISGLRLEPVGGWRGSMAVARITLEREDTAASPPVSTEETADNPYDFLVTDENFSVLDYDARGDGFTDDTRAFQMAINAASGSGSGRVVVPGGRCYVVSSLELHHDVEFRLGRGSVIRQSGDVRDYRGGLPHGPGNPLWTPANRPLFNASGAQRIKIIGPGTLRMNDFGPYAAPCGGAAAFAFTDCRDVTIQDVDIIHASGPAVTLRGDTNVYVGNVRVLFPACPDAQAVSADQATAGVKTERVVVGAYTAEPASKQRKH